MSKTIVALFDTQAAAETAVRELRDSGVEQGEISVVAKNADDTSTTVDGTSDDSSAEDGAGTGAVSGTVLGGALGLLVGTGLLAIPGIGPVLAAGPLAAAIGTLGAAVGAGALGAGIGAATGGLLGGLVGAGVPEEDANIYAEGVRRGGTLVTVNANDSNADQVVAVLERNSPIDVDMRGSEYRESGWKGFDAASEPISREQPTPSSKVAVGGERVLPVIEEELQVDKREVQRGTVRVHTRVVEKPVEQQVTLRDEHVSVERRPVDRPVADTDRDMFKEQSMELSEQSEEAVVSKTARVVEEVIVEKDVADRVETVRDTVRRTDVDVSEANANAGDARGYDSFASDFRSHYQTTYGSSGKAYATYEPGYRYGHGLSDNERYRGKEWQAIEGDVRQDWERQHSDSPWEQVKDSVRYAWDKARGKA